MVGDPRAHPIETIGRDRVPRAWVTAGMPLHAALVDAAVDLAPANVTVTGRRAEAEAPFSALERALDGGRDLEGRLDETSAWLIVIEPQWLDGQSLASVSRAGESETPIVVVSSDPTAGGDGLRPTLAPEHRWFAEPWLDETKIERWIEAQLGRTLGDAALTEMLAAAGPSSHLLALLVADAARREMRMPGGADSTATNGDAVMSFVAQAMGDVEPEAGRALLFAAVTATPVPGPHRPAAFAAGLADLRGRPLPAVTTALIETLDDVHRNDLPQEVSEARARGLLTDEETARAFLRIGRATGPASGAVEAAVAQTIASDPARALAMLDLIPETPAGAELRMHALALVGRIGEAAAVADRILAAGPSPRASLVTAAGLTAAARFRVAAGAYEASDPDDLLRIGARLLGAPVRAAIGQRPVIGPSAPASLTAAAISAFAVGAEGLVDGRPDALTELQDGAEMAAEADATLWPDTPHTLAALALTFDFDHERASLLLSHALTNDVGGAAHRARHRLGAGWVAVRSGRWADGETAIADLSETALSLRDRLGLVGLQVSLARRSGDVTALQLLLEPAVELVQRHPIDLVSLSAHAEIAIAVARMGASDRAGGLLDQLDDFVAGLPARPWRNHASWARAVAGLLASNESWLASGARGLTAPLDVIAPALTRLTEAPVEVVAEAAEFLETIGQIHEAAIVASAAALGRPDDSGRSLVIAASRLRGLLPGRGLEAASGLEALSDRELEVARELIDGRRYKEIGERLFISAKTVEHHVAHIKTKLGASTRSEMISALRQALG